MEFGLAAGINSKCCFYDCKLKLLPLIQEFKVDPLLKKRLRLKKRFRDFNSAIYPFCHEGVERVRYLLEKYMVLYEMNGMAFLIKTKFGTLKLLVAHWALRRIQMRCVRNRPNRLNTMNFILIR